MKAIEIWGWCSRIKPEDRNSRKYSGPVRFGHKSAAQAYVDRFQNEGGVIASVSVVDGVTNPFLSLEEYDRLCKMTADEIQQFRNRTVTEDMLNPFDRVD